MDYYNEQVKDRCERAATFIIEEKATVRKAAEKLGVSKSTVHKDVAQRLREYDPQLAKKVWEILQINKSERHLRGGEATKRKYLARQKNRPEDEKTPQDDKNS